MPHATGPIVDGMRCMGQGRVVEVGRILAGHRPLHRINGAQLDAAMERG